MYLDGVTSYLPVYMPTKEEYESGDYPEIEMTSAELEWDPQTDQFERCKNAMLDAHGNLREGLPSKPRLVIKELRTESLQGDTVDITNDAHFGSVLESNANISLASVCKRNISRLARVKRKLEEVELTPRDGEIPLNAGGTIKSQQRKQVHSPTLAKRWRIPDSKAKNMVCATT